MLELMRHHQAPEPVVSFNAPTFGGWWQSPGNQHNSQIQIRTMQGLSLVQNTSKQNWAKQGQDTGGALWPYLFQICSKGTIGVSHMTCPKWHAESHGEVTKVHMWVSAFSALGPRPCNPWPILFPTQCGLPILYLAAGGQPGGETSWRSHILQGLMLSIPHLSHFFPFSFCLCLIARWPSYDWALLYFNVHAYACV